VGTLKVNNSKSDQNLKNQRVPVRLHELDARLHELDANCHSLAQQLPQSVTVTQRMKLEEEQIKMFSEVQGVGCWVWGVGFSWSHNA
jgi:hypothetical protein